MNLINEIFLIAKKWVSFLGCSSPHFHLSPRETWNLFVIKIYTQRRGAGGRYVFIIFTVFTLFMKHFSLLFLLLFILIFVYFHIIYFAFIIHLFLLNFYLVYYNILFQSANFIWPSFFFKIIFQDSILEPCKPWLAPLSTTPLRQLIWRAS